MAALLAARGIHSFVSTCPHAPPPQPCARMASSSLLGNEEWIRGMETGFAVACKRGRRDSKFVRAVIYEPQPIQHKYTTLRPLVERNFGSGHGVLYQTPRRGKPSPFGPNADDAGVNFAVYTSSATSVSLCLFTYEDLQKGIVTAEVPFHPILNRTGDVWHLYLPQLSPNLLYGYRVDGPFAPEEGLHFDSSSILVDPYAKTVVSREKFGIPANEGENWPQMAGTIPDPTDQFDWEGDSPPSHRMEDLVIYEMHVRGFTNHETSKVKDPGTYAGLVEKIPYLKSMGINAIELLPIHEFNELEFSTFTEDSKEYKVNFWGYSTINFFSPMVRYSAAGNSDCGKNAVREFKNMVKECHKNGIEVILDVVFNHSAEGNENGLNLSFRGFDNRVYYMIAPKGEFYNYSGCGNTINCNHPVVRRFIVDCLRYWVLEMHVDGFRFDLASILTRASSLWDRTNVFGSPDDSAEDILTTGTPLNEPPLIDMISNDPILRNVKLIAEAWDAGGLYQVGSFPHWGIWAEWNGQYRDVVRQFIKGTDGMVGSFAQMICGSPHLYQEGGRKPYHSINFITAHDGFTLMDLVSYNDKKNEKNGENNNDGENHNNSWNCGYEGETNDKKIVRLRQRQIKNFFVALLVSQGVPMITMGDEYAHTKKGNNNTYCHDSELNYFRWDLFEKENNFVSNFFSQLLKLRRDYECLRLSDFPTADRLQWHGFHPDSPDWSESSRFIAFTLKDSVKGELFVAFNASHVPGIITLPYRDGFTWEALIDTGRPSPYDFIQDDDKNADIIRAQFTGFLQSWTYPILAYSSIVLVKKYVM